jgi:hypothetical protein
LVVCVLGMSNPTVKKDRPESVFDRPPDFSNGTYKDRRGAALDRQQERTITDADIKAIHDAHSCPFKNVDPKHLEELEEYWPTIKTMASATQKTGDRIISIALWGVAMGVFLILVGAFAVAIAQLCQKYQNVISKVLTN